MQSVRANKHSPPVVSLWETTSQVFSLYRGCLANSVYFNNKFFNNDKVYLLSKIYKEHYYRYLIKSSPKYRKRFYEFLHLNLFFCKSIRCNASHKNFLLFWYSFLINDKRSRNGRFPVSISTAYEKKNSFVARDSSSESKGIPSGNSVGFIWRITSDALDWRRVNSVASIRILFAALKFQAAEWMLGGRRRKQRGPSTSTLH